MPSSGTAVKMGNGAAGSHGWTASASELSLRNSDEADAAAVRRSGWARAQCRSVVIMESVGSSHASHRRFRMSAMTTKTCGWVIEPIYQSRNANTGSRGVVASTYVPPMAPFDVLD